MELSGDAARSNKKIRITPRFVELAMRMDAEFDILMKDTTIAGGGFVSEILKNSKRN